LYLREIDPYLNVEHRICSIEVLLGYFFRAVERCAAQCGESRHYYGQEKEGKESKAQEGKEVAPLARVLCSFFAEHPLERKTTQVLGGFS
jgi:hypothetical protein